MITSTDTKLIYDGDGSTTVFPYTFGIIEASNINVIRIDSDGSEHMLDADYYVDVANGNVNYPGYAPGSAPPVEEQPTVLPVNSKLCIYRSVPQTQNTDLPDTYPLSVIEASLDKLTMLLQEISEITGRSFKLSIGNSAGIDMVLPVEPGKTFKWAADGKSLVLADDPAMVYEATVTLYAAVQAAITATEAARDAAILARNNANTSAINAALSESNALAYKNQTAALVAIVDMSSYYTKPQVDALIPTTLPASDVYDWAKAANKPSYTYSDVGAAAFSHGHTVSQISDFPASMPASDVYAWAKAASKPSYTASEVGLGNVTNESKETMFTNPTFTGKTTANVVEVKQALGTISTNTTINTASGDIVTATLGAAITIGITANASASTCRVCTLILTNGGAYAITWNSAIKWAGGTAPTLTASGVDVLHFMTVDNGTTWYGCLGGKGFA